MEPSCQSHQLIKVRILLNIAYDKLFSIRVSLTKAMFTSSTDYVKQMHYGITFWLITSTPSDCRNSEHAGKNSFTWVYLHVTMKPRRTYKNFWLAAWWLDRLLRDFWWYAASSVTITVPLTPVVWCLHVRIFHSCATSVLNNINIRILPLFISHKTCEFL